MSTTTILHEDEAVLAVLKPAGVTVIPARDEPPENALVQRLERERKEKLWVVHRIDRDTSGVVLFARNAAAHRALSVAFESREVKKQYLAWTRGVPSPAGETITIPLHSARKGKMRPALPGEADALPSETRYEVLTTAETKLGPIAKVRVEPHTGRQHQIRVHLRWKETPLLVDAFYAKCERVEANALGADSPEIPRLTLHAEKIAFTHPTTRQALEITAPLPPDLAALDAWMAQRTSSR